MSSNPFRTSAVPIKQPSQWIGRREAWESLDSVFRKRENAILYGVEGSGKSSLLRSFFNSDFRKQCAREENEEDGLKTLILTVNLELFTTGDLFGHILGQMRGQIKTLLQNTDDAAVYEALAEEMQEPGSTRSCLTGCLSLLSQCGYLTVFIMDHFDLFLFSSSITSEHHDCLCSLISNGYIQCIAATNYDVMSVTLGEDIGGSEFLQQCTAEVFVPGFLPEEAKAFALSRLDAQEAARFSDSLLAQLWFLTGGIPLLFERAMHAAYQAVIIQEDPFPMPAIAAELDNRGRDLIGRWLLHLGDPARKMLSMAAGVECSPGMFDEPLYTGMLGSVPVREMPRLLLALLDPQQKSCAAQLRKRGLLIHRRAYVEGGKKGTVLRQETDRCVPNCGLLVQLLHGKDFDLSEPLLSVEEVTQITAELHPSADLLAHLLTGAESVLLDPSRLLPDTEDAEATPEELHEAEISRLAAKALPFSCSEEEIAEADPAVLRENVLQLAEALGISDSLPASVAEHIPDSCLYYLSAALWMDLQSPTFPPTVSRKLLRQVRMLLYGNCLEQAMHESLYPLLHAHPEFCSEYIYPTRKRPELYTFGKMAATRITLGNYTSFLSERLDKMAALSESHKVKEPCAGGRPANGWQDWWEDHYRKLEQGTLLRNQIHPPEAPEEAKITEIRDLILGREGLINGSRVARSIYARFQTPDVYKPTQEQCREIAGRTLTMQCTGTTRKGHLSGRTEVWNSEQTVQVKKCHLKAHGLEAKSLIGQALPVHIIAYNQTEEQLEADLEC